MVLSEMTVKGHESQRSCICVLQVQINGLRDMTLQRHESLTSCICVLVV